jgi:GNAT superfamily N-acetyltransferase
MDDATLIREIERTLVAYAPAYAGFPSQTLLLSDVVVQRPEMPGAGIWGSLGGFALDPDRVDRRIDELLALLAPAADAYIWIVGPAARPYDLARHLEQHGLVPYYAWDGMALRDLSMPIPLDAAVTIEPLQLDNAADFAGMMPGGREEERARYAAAFHHVAATGQQETQFFLGRVDGVPAAWASVRLEGSGIAYFRQGFTLPAYRGRGLYRSLVAARLAVARAAGCSAVVLQALTTSSSPILARLGFVTLCHLTGYRRQTESAGHT